MRQGVSFRFNQREDTIINLARGWINSLSLGLAADIDGFAGCLAFPGMGMYKCSQERGSTSIASAHLPG